MTIFFSASTIGFYSGELKQDYNDAGSWPEDAIEISDRWYNHLIEGQSNGKTINVNEYGQPVLSDPPPITKDEAIAEAKAQKSQLLADAMASIAPLQDAVDLGIATSNESKQLNVWRKYRVELNRIDTGSAPDISWPVRPE